MTDETQRHPGGRPTDYRPEFCDRVIEYGAQGKSKTWMAAQFGVARKTIYEWEKVYPEFSDALARAMALSQAHWEDQGQENLTSNTFQSSVWSRSMAARFPEDWKEVKREEQTGPDGGPVVQKNLVEWQVVRAPGSDT